MSICGGDLWKTAPRIGAARSHDRGRTWTDLDGVDPEHQGVAVARMPWAEGECSRDRK